MVPVSWPKRTSTCSSVPAGIAMATRLALAAMAAGAMAVAPPAASSHRAWLTAMAATLRWQRKETAGKREGVLPGMGRFS